MVRRYIVLESIHIGDQLNRHSFCSRSPERDERDYYFQSHWKFSTEFFAINKERGRERDFLNFSNTLSEIERAITITMTASASSFAYSVISFQTAIINWKLYSRILYYTVDCIVVVVVVVQRGERKFYSLNVKAARSKTFRARSSAADVYTCLILCSTLLFIVKIE